MSNRTSPHTPDIQMTFSRPQFSEEEVRKFFAPVLDDEPTSEPDEPWSLRSASDETARNR
jgi:hypothetical protein